MKQMKSIYIQLLKTLFHHQIHYLRAMLFFFFFFVFIKHALLISSNEVYSYYLEFQPYNTFLVLIKDLIDKFFYIYNVCYDHVFPIFQCGLF